MHHSVRVSFGVQKMLRRAISGLTDCEIEKGCRKLYGLIPLKRSSLFVLGKKTGFQVSAFLALRVRVLFGPLAQNRRMEATMGEIKKPNEHQEALIFAKHEKLIRIARECGLKLKVPGREKEQKEGISPPFHP